MPTYTDSTAVLNELPASPPSSVTDKTAVDIASASAMVESLSGPRFSLSYKSGIQKFPDITDSPATPEIIKQAATFLAASYQYQRLEQVNRNKEGTATVRYEERAMKLLEDIREGRAAVYLSDGTRLGSSLLDHVEDSYYQDRIDPKEIFNATDLDVHYP